MSTYLHKDIQSRIHISTMVYQRPKETALQNIWSKS